MIKLLLCIMIMVSLMNMIINGYYRQPAVGAWFLALYLSCIVLYLVNDGSNVFNFWSCKFNDTVDIQDVQEINFHDSIISPKNCESAIKINGDYIAISGGNIYQTGGYGIYMEGGR